MTTAPSTDRQLRAAAFNSVDGSLVTLDCAALPTWSAAVWRDSRSNHRRDVLLLLDEAVVASDLSKTVETDLRASAPGTVLRRVVTGDVTLRGAEELGDVVARSGMVVAMGGGRVIDLAKTARGLHDAPKLRDQIEGRTREGFLDVAGPPLERTPLAAVPTTLGTGSERSQNAVVGVTEGQLLVGGPLLRPTLAVQDARASRGLPRRMVLAGVFEALCRTVGPFVGGAGHSSRQDELAIAVTTRLVQLGEWLAALSDPGGAVGDQMRGEVLRLGGLSHRPELHRGRDPFGFKAWYVAHELAWATGMAKADALALVMPAAWQAMAAGCQGLGSTARLERLWRSVARSVPTAQEVSTAPHEGLARLVAGWGLHARPAGHVDVSALVGRVEHRWGNGLQELGAVPQDVLRTVLDISVSPST